MFNIKVFPEFAHGKVDSERERRLLKKLFVIKETCKANYVNVSFYEHNDANISAAHFLTYPLSWVSHYVTHFYSNIDPLFKLDFRTVSFVDWDDLYRERQQAELFNSFKEFGIGTHGLTIVHHIQRDLYCCLSAVFTVDDSNWPATKLSQMEILRFQAESIGEIYNDLYLNAARKNFKITPREAECLYWVAIGKTDDQIGTLLNIGKWTVNGHLQSAKSKLDSPNRSAAVARALVAGIISLKRAV